MRVETIVPQVLGLAGAGSCERLCWFDGADGRGIVGLWPDEEIVANGPEVLGVLRGMDSRWRGDPGGTWMGWLTYDAGRDAARGQRGRRTALPGMVLRRFSAGLRIDGAEARVFGRGEAAARIEDALARVERREETGWPFGPLEPLVDREEYIRRIRRAQAEIFAGNTYQVNLSQRFTAKWSDEVDPSRGAALAYGHLRARSPATMGAFVGTGAGWIVCNSPETLFEVELRPGGDVARSRPIKGTRPRVSDPEQNDRLQAALRASPKDAAEHLMIVDLVRNDLGALARPGSVEAARCPSMMTLATVHHLVSEVRCILRDGWRLDQLVAAMFPGGSVTGAPKHRTMEIIDALEGEARGIYCGGLLLLDDTGARCNIAIRTGTIDASGLSVRSGGGIVADSEPAAEWRETLDKVAAFSG